MVPDTSLNRMRGHTAQNLSIKQTTFRVARHTTDILTKVNSVGQCYTADQEDTQFQSIRGCWEGSSVAQQA